MSPTAQPIAIVGYAFRFPPDADDDETFWEILEKGRNVATEWPESRANLDSFSPKDPEHESKVISSPKSRYAGMGRELLRFDVFKKTMMQAAKVYREQGASWDILDALDKAEQIDRPEFSQPLCTALQIALVELLRSWNILPAAVVGHSSEEIAAAFAADMISLESACRIAYYRGRLAGALAKESSDGMLSVNLSEDAIQTFFERIDLAEKVHVACFNSPTNVRLSGGENDLDLVKTKLDEEGKFTRKLRTGAAYHSPSMASIAAEYEVSIGAITSQNRPTPSAVMVSTVENLVSQVRFADALRYVTVEAPNDNANFAIHDILEIGPHAALRRPIDNTLISVGVNCLTTHFSLASIQQ